MIPSRTFDISPGVVSAVRNNLPDKVQLLHKELNMNNELARMLDALPWYYNERSGNVYVVIVDKYSLTVSSNGKGAFTAEFDVNYYNGCRDMEKNEEQIMVMKFTIDFNTHEIYVEGEELPEREPDEI